MSADAAKAKRFPLLVFDWDGTLMDSPRTIVLSIQHACRDLGLPVPDDARASHVIGLGLHDALQYAVPGMPVSVYGKMVERYRFHYLKQDAEIPLYPGTEAMLSRLKQSGHTLAVATGKSTAGLERALEATGLGVFFTAYRCADRTASKPAPDMLHELMEELETPAGATLMIGDTSHDLRMAQHAGVSAVGITHGAHPAEELRALSPLACVDSTAELDRWLLQYA
jgi:phosphoglycolate phosphatase